MIFKQPLYVMPHGIEVIGEYAPGLRNPYWRVRIRPHRFFPDVRVRYGGIYVRRSRVVLASKLGRPITSAEHAHHCDEDRTFDAPTNVEGLSAAEHNRHHKTNARHRAISRDRISKSLRRAYAEGRHARSHIMKRDHLGRIAS